MIDDSDFLIGQARLQTMREETFFHVRGQPTPMSGLDDELDQLIPLLEAAQEEAGIAQVGPVITRYFLSGGPDTYVMELGVPVRPGTPACLRHRRGALVRWSGRGGRTRRSGRDRRGHRLF